MKKVLIGHRGVGKSALLIRHASYFPQVPHFDLDQEIEKHLQFSIFNFFQRYSETDFRKLEIEIFRKISTEYQDYVIALGGGFELGGLPPDIEKVFVRRRTDIDGRIFLDRPRLESALSPLAEYKLRYEVREKAFLANADSLYELSEGLTAPNEIEQAVLNSSFFVSDAYYTLSVQDLGGIDSLVKTFRNIELRTDLLAAKTIHRLLIDYPSHAWLVSIRTGGPDLFAEANFRDVDVSFYIEGCQILSSHAENIETGIRHLSAVTEKTHLKLCPIVENFADLEKGYKWQQGDSQNRSFLPRSTTGKWLWFRQISKYTQKLNFLRNFTNAFDQPSVSEWLTLPDVKPQAWAAVLGNPIHHSWSPMIHQKYFNDTDADADWKSFFTAISLTAAEAEGALKFLAGLGLKFAAVTSPLKEVVFQLAGSSSDIAAQYGSANTLFFQDGEIVCENTDLDGFAGLVKNIPAGATVAVWGGGGTLRLMQSVLPKAYYYASRTGQLRNEGVTELQFYDYLIWAAPRRKETSWPDDRISVKIILDLNYTENSPGLEFAARRKIGYINGLEMLMLQAEKQQEFWSRCERK